MKIFKSDFGQKIIELINDPRILIPALLSIIGFSFTIGYYIHEIRHEREHSKLQNNITILRDSIKTQISENFSLKNNISELTSFGKKVAFNNLNNDRPLLRGVNLTVHPNSNDNWDYMTDAFVGDTISLCVYFHNSSNVTAKNIKIHVSLQIEKNLLIATGWLYCDNCPTANIGSALFRINSSEFKWEYVSNSYYKNQESISNGKKDVFDFSQSGVEIFYPEGLSLPIIYGGWHNQGSIVYKMLISENRN